MMVLLRSDAGLLMLVWSLLRVRHLRSMLLALRFYRLWIVMVLMLCRSTLGVARIRRVVGTGGRRHWHWRLILLERRRLPLILLL